MAASPRFGLSSLAGPLLMESLADRWRVFLARGAAAIAFGVVALVWPHITLQALAILVGAFLLVDGAFALAAALRGGRGGLGPRWWLAALGGAGVLLGVLAFVRPAETTAALVTLAAVWAIVIGFLQIAGALLLRREIQGEWLLAIGGILSIVVGVTMIRRPDLGAVALGWTIGFLALALGVLHTMFALRLRRWREATAYEPLADDDWR